MVDGKKKYSLQSILEEDFLGGGVVLNRFLSQFTLLFCDVWLYVCIYVCPLAIKKKIITPKRSVSIKYTMLGIYVGGSKFQRTSKLHDVFKSYSYFAGEKIDFSVNEYL